MGRYSPEDLKALYEKVIEIRGHQTPSGVQPRYTEEEYRIRSFVGVLRKKEYQYSRIRRKSYCYFPDYQRFLRRRLSEVPKYINDEKLAVLARWRLRIGK